MQPGSSLRCVNNAESGAESNFNGRSAEEVFKNFIRRGSSSEAAQ
jgi:hypothetical protein